VQAKQAWRFCVTSLLVVFVVAVGVAQAADYNYISQADFKARLDAGDHENGKMAIMTSQTPEEYATGHLKAAFATFARPLESDADFAKLDPFLAKVKDTTEDIVIICPRGKGGATRPFDYFKKHGVAVERMYILEGGQGAFNAAYPDAIVKGN
jgi:thiosulfate/3-mercaptopyruvate sulfurtransferase